MHYGLWGVCVTSVFYDLVLRWVGFWWCLFDYCFVVRVVVLLGLFFLRLSCFDRIGRCWELLVRFLCFTSLWFNCLGGCLC